MNKTEKVIDIEQLRQEIIKSEKKILNIDRLVFLCIDKINYLGSNVYSVWYSVVLSNNFRIINIIVCNFENIDILLKSRKEY